MELQETDIDSQEEEIELEQTAALIKGNEEDDLQAGELLTAEEFAYKELLEAGGIPSHQRTAREHIEPPKDDIFYFWADETDRWAVFREQLVHWQRFLSFQKRWRPGWGLCHNTRGIFPSYVFEVVCSLERAGVMYYQLVGEDFLEHDLTKQTRAVTWLEYFYYVYKECEMAADTISTEPWYWDKPWSEFVTSGALTGKELNHVMDMVGAKAERFEEMEGEVADDQSPTRMDMVARFARASDVGRQANGDFKRHNVLLEWILRQLYSICGKEYDDGDCDPKFNAWGSIKPKIWEECWKEAVPLATVVKEPVPERPAAPATTFHKFMNLPPELRRQIWLESLPKEPTTHYFQIVNESHPTSKFYFWSSKRIGIKATRAFESGYKTIVPFINSCYEARQVIWNHYRGQFRRTNSMEHNRQTDPPNFSNFDWLPESDLIVLCFPPEKGEIPATDAISLEVGFGKARRNVGIYIGEKITQQQKYGGDDDVFHMDALDWDMRRVRNIPKMLQTLCRRRRDGEQCEKDETGGGIGKLFLIPGGCEQQGDEQDRQGWCVAEDRCVRAQKIPNEGFGGLSWHTVMRFKNSIAGGLLQLSGAKWEVEVLEEWRV